MIYLLIYLLGFFATMYNMSKLIIEEEEQIDIDDGITIIVISFFSWLGFLIATSIRFIKWININKKVVIYKKNNTNKGFKMNGKRELDEVGNFKCKYCGEAYEDEDDLAQHESLKHQDNLEDYFLENIGNNKQFKLKCLVKQIRRTK